MNNHDNLVSDTIEGKSRLLKRVPGVMAIRSNSWLLNQSLVPSCDLTLDLRNKDGVQEATLQIISKLLPDWADNVSHIEIHRISGAMTNAVFYVEAQGKPKLLLRVYGLGCDQIVDRKKELVWLARLSEDDVSCPQLLGMFANGRIEEYLESTTLTHDDIRDPDISSQIAKALRGLHDVVQTYPPQENHELELWKNIDRWFSIVKEQPHEDRWRDLHLDRLGSDIEKCKRSLKASQSPIVFAHNDTQYGNVLRINKTGELVIVDFEYAGYNSRGYDIANHFCEWMYDYHSEQPAEMRKERFPTSDEQIFFLSAYLTENDDIEVADLQKEVCDWLKASHLHWALWGLVQACQSEIDFDYFTYARLRLEEFRRQLQTEQSRALFL